MTQLSVQSMLRPMILTSRSSSRHIFAGVLIVSFVASLGGCGTPSSVNNKLRAEKQKLQDEVAALKRESSVHVAQIRALENQRGTLPTLPQDRLDKLFTVYGIQLGRLTGGDDWDPSQPGDDGLKIVAVPVDQQGEKFKAAGSFTIDAFDLAASGDTHIGHWTFDVEQAKQNWFGSGLLYTYVLKCPWQKIPAHGELTVKVTFVDELTQREFTAQVVCKANPPKVPATKPAQQP